MWVHSRNLRSKVDMIFSLRQLQEKCRVQRKPLYISLIDLSKAFDLVNTKGLFKETNILGQDVSITPSISIGDYTLKVVEDFTYLGFTVPSNLSLDTELNKRISKAAAALARLGERVRDNTMLTISTKIKVYQACVLSTLCYVM